MVSFLFWLIKCVQNHSEVNWSKEKKMIYSFFLMLIILHDELIQRSAWTNLFLSLDECFYKSLSNLIYILVLHMHVKNKRNSLFHQSFLSIFFYLPPTLSFSVHSYRLLFTKNKRQVSAHIWLASTESCTWSNYPWNND
jgi:hypothetical protein